VLVLGVGNILLRDEGVGVRVVQAMEAMHLPEGVELFDGATAGLDLLDALADRERVIVIDALAGQYAPGTVLRLTADDLQGADAASVSLHETGLVETLAVAERLGIVPEEVVVLGVQPREVSWGLELSAEVSRLVPQIIELVMAELRAPKAA